MKKMAYDVKKSLCAGCSLALRRFIGHMEGVESIEIECGKIVIDVDTSRIDEEELDELLRDSLDKLGYRLHVTG